MKAALIGLGERILLVLLFLAVAAASVLNGLGIYKSGVDTVSAVDLGLGVAALLVLAVRIAGAVSRIVAFSAFAFLVVIDLAVRWWGAHA